METPELLERNKQLLQSARRLILVADFRVGQSDYYEAVSVLNQALHYLNLKNFVEASQETMTERKELAIEISLKLIVAYIALKKYKLAQDYLDQVFKSDRNNSKAIDLQGQLLKTTGKINNQQLKVVV